MMIGEVIHKWRVMRELTQKETAGRIGIQVSTLCKMEQGGEIRPKTRRALEQWLFEGNEGENG